MNEFVQQAIDDMAYRLGNMSHSEYMAAKQRRLDSKLSNQSLRNQMSSKDPGVAAKARSLYASRMGQSVKYHNE